MDVVLLSRLQFALTVIVHFLFVPLSIGTGLVMAIAQTRAKRSGSEEDAALAQFWVKVFTVTFAVGVATGITMEFSFGTNWANYSRFVGDIFGAPLAAEALLAFFLESTFLGVLIFGRGKVSETFYVVSAWLVWFGSCLSALWIIIANSWMQTPAGYQLVDGKAQLTDFFAAALNYSTLPRYGHVIAAVLCAGGLVALAVGAYHYLKGNKSFGAKNLSIGFIVALIGIVVMVPAMHQQAVEVAQQQPEKLAAMEGQYETGPMDMAIVGWVDESNETLVALEVPIPGMTSLLASNDATTEYPGINDFPEGDTPNVQLIFQNYHIMVGMFGFICLWFLFGLIAVLQLRRGKEPSRLMLKALQWGPLFPMVGIQTGWAVAEFGRQPWIVYHELRTADAISPSVTSTELLITLILFAIIYALLVFTYVKVVMRVIRRGPGEGASAGVGAGASGEGGVEAGTGVDAAADAGLGAEGQVM